MKGLHSLKLANKLLLAFAVCAMITVAVGRNQCSDPVQFEHHANHHV